MQIYTDLLVLRRTSNDTRGLRGTGLNVFHIDNNNKLIAFHRHDKGGAGDDVVVIANFANKVESNYVIGFPVAGTWHARFNSDSQRYGSDLGNTPTPDITTTSGSTDGLAQHGTITVGAYSVVVYSQ